VVTFAWFLLGSIVAAQTTVPADPASSRQTMSLKERLRDVEPG
jgi:hypothetical protein